MKQSRECKGCGRVFEVWQESKQKFCNPSCRGRTHAKKVFGANPNAHLATPTVGALNELRVAADLMYRGFDVFRALSPSCPCDLAVLHDKVLLRIEVKTGYRNLVNQKIYLPTIKTPGLFDHLAVVLQTGAIAYSPPLPAMEESK